MLSRVVPVPPIPLRIIPTRDVLDDLVRREVLAGELRPAPPGPLEAILLLVREGPAVLAGTLAVLLRGGAGFGSAVVPVVELVGGAVVLGNALMAEGGSAGVEVPWCLCDIFWTKPSIQ